MLRSCAAFALSTLGGCDLNISEDDIVETSGTSASSSGTTSGMAGNGGVQNTGGGSDGGGGQGAAGAMGGGGQGGMPPTDCWDQPVSGWAISTLDLSALGGGAPNTPYLSADGLSLTYIAANGNGRRPHQATRASRDAPFVGGSELASWPAEVNGDILAASVTTLGSEMIFLNSSEFHWAANTLDVWGAPSVFAMPGGTGFFNTPSPSEDGARFVFYRFATVPRLFEASRTPPVVAGDPFVDEVMIAPQGILDGDWVMCGALSPDGTRLFFSSNAPDPVPGFQGFSPATMKVYLSRRSTIDAPFGPPIEIPQFDLDTVTPCVSSVTADGCEVIFAHPPEFFTATRTPR